MITVILEESGLLRCALAPFFSPRMGAIAAGMGRRSGARYVKHVMYQNTGGRADKVGAGAEDSDILHSDPDEMLVPSSAIPTACVARKQFHCSDDSAACIFFGSKVVY